MNTNAKRLLIAFVAMALIACSIAGWATVKVVGWARDLPNRIVIDGDALADGFGAAITESYHAALLNGDSATRVQVLNDQFIPMIDETPEAATWISNEYRDDILTLVESEDTAVSSAASSVLLILDSDAASQNH